MKRELLSKELNYIKDHRIRRRWRGVLLLLSVVVLFATVHVLVLPAITMGDCQIPEHTHSAACYGTAGSASDAAVLVCGLEEHSHSADDFPAAGADSPEEVQPQALEAADKLTDDSAYVTGVSITEITDGMGPFDADDIAGNDSSDGNRIVRTFDTVTYQFNVQMDTYGNNSYGEARVRLEFILPLTEGEAVFEQSAMAWMEEPVLTTETRSIDGEEVECQVLICYKHLLPSEGHQSVVPGNFGENVTVSVKSMKNGASFTPLFSAAMEYGTWDGDCPEHKQPEKASVRADAVTVSAAPKYNIRIGATSAYKTTFDFNAGNKIAQTYGEGYGKGDVTGRVVKYGIVIQLYNDNASKGLKGIELPDGSPITFDVQFASSYTINTPNEGSGYEQGQDIQITNEYLPLLWSCDANRPGQTNQDGRELNEGEGCAQEWAPYASESLGSKDNTCYDSGTWSATQEQTVVHVTVSGYRINTDHLPTTNADGTTEKTDAYGAELGIGCFSAGELWMVQPFNSSDGLRDVVSQYGQGMFKLDAHAVNMKAKTVSGADFADPDGSSDAQTRSDDDWASVGVELRLSGTLQNRVAYADALDIDTGVGLDKGEYRNGLDFAMVGTELQLLGGFSYTHQNDPDELLYWGTTLVKFYGSAIEVLDDSLQFTYYNLSDSSNPPEAAVLYATKKDGKEWESDYELLHTYEDDLVFYKSLSEIPDGRLCVGLLYCFKEDTFGTITDSTYFLGHVKAQVQNNRNLAGKAYMLASTSRVWTKSMFENAGMTLEQIPDWTNPDTRLSNFPEDHYISANIEGSTWYVKTDYSQAANGIVEDHNSDWRHWGDTLLVIGYKAGITKALCQTNGNMVKDTYYLDAEQRVVDFRLQPSVTYDQGGMEHRLTTTVTITDTLPKHLTYRPGSAYFGGTYTQSSVNGGTQGAITGGTLREPDSVVNNADGTQTLVWLIPDVTVGDSMPAIYYSADIGNRNVPDKDVSTGTTSLTNRVRISATHDLRQPTIKNGNYAEVGLMVTRGTASSFGKYSRQKLVEPDGVIDYVVYFDNNSASGADVALLDTMPYDAVNGSHFNGTYVVNSWKLDASKCTVDNLALYYTMDESYKDATITSLGGSEAAKNVMQSWERAAISSDGTVTSFNGRRPVAWAILGSLSANQRIEISLQIQLQPAVGSTNNYFVNTVSSGDTVVYVENPTVHRTLEGLTWLDQNLDGLQDSGEARLSGVQVSLWKLKDGGNASLESDYEPFCYSGTTTQMVIQTGQKVSYLAGGETGAASYDTGRYLFTDLPAGTYAVKFTHGSETPDISGLIATLTNQGGASEDHRDSDGVPTYAHDAAGALQQTMIPGIELPRVEEMSVMRFESKYHDSGFYYRGHELPETGGVGTLPYMVGGGLLIAAAVCLLYLRGKRKSKA